MGYNTSTMPRTNPTLSDIAQHSGVSTATVSRVLSRTGSVSRSLVAKVNASVRALGFERETRGLIALLTSNYGSTTVAEKGQGVEEEAERMGYTAVPIHFPTSADSRERNLQLLKVLDFDAMIVLKGGLHPHQIREKYRLGDMPTVVVNQTIDEPGIHCIDIDREVAMYKAVSYLISLGHKRLAYLTAPLDGRFAIERKRGIDRAIAETGVEVDVRQSSATLETGYQITGSLLSGKESERPTAILAFNDMVAVGALEAARAHGKSVPGDLSVVGFDDLFISRHTCPPLTTIHQPWLQMGHLAVRKVDSLLSGTDSERGGLTILESPLIVRESTGRPRD